MTLVLCEMSIVVLPIRALRRIATRMSEEKSKRPRSRKNDGDYSLRRRKSHDSEAGGSLGSDPGTSHAPRDRVKSAKRLSRETAPKESRREEAAKAIPYSAPQAEPHPGERISKVMARAGACSRRDAERLIAEGRVAVNGQVLESPAFNVTEGDVITIDGAPLAARERTRLFLFHKPAGLVTSARDPEGRETVFDYIAERHPELPRLVSVGRLDINTEGLLLLSNDGSLARVLELPTTGWTRRYRVRAHGEVDQALLDALAEGVTIGDMTYAPIEARLDREQGANAWLTMSLSEGKNREIKRVLEHLRIDVTRLIRVSYGPFQLGDLAEGAIEEVRLKTLREQLGKGLAELAGVDFSSPLREAPSATEREAARVAALNRPRKHVSTMRRQQAEKPDATAPRQRVERAVTADRKGRAVAVERVVAQKKEAYPKGRNARRFEALRQEGAGEAEAAAKPRFERPHQRREDQGFAPHGGTRRRSREAPASTGGEERGFAHRPRRESGGEAAAARRNRPAPFEHKEGKPFEGPRRPRAEGEAKRERRRQGDERPHRDAPPRGFNHGETERPRGPRKARAEAGAKREFRRQGDERPHRDAPPRGFKRGETERLHGPRKPRAEAGAKQEFRRQGEERPRRDAAPRGFKRGDDRKPGGPRKPPGGPRKPPGGKGKPPSRPPR